MAEFRTRKELPPVPAGARDVARTLVRLKSDRDRMQRGKRPKVSEQEAQNMLKIFPEEAGAWYKALAQREGVH